MTLVCLCRVLVRAPLRAQRAKEQGEMTQAQGEGLITDQATSPQASRCLDNQAASLARPHAWIEA